MTKFEDAIRRAREDANKAVEKADPVVDGWLRRVMDDTRTPIFLAVFVLFLLLAGAWLAR